MTHSVREKTTKNSLLWNGAYPNKQIYNSESAFDFVFLENSNTKTENVRRFMKTAYKN